MNTHNWFEIDPGSNPNLTPGALESMAIKMEMKRYQNIEQEEIKESKI